jgi:hypothetical protein
VSVITDVLPIRIGLFSRTAREPKHSAPAEVDRLRHKLAGAELLIGGYRLQLDMLEREHAQTIARIDERHAEIVRGLERELAEAHRRIDIAGQANAAADLTQEIDTRSLRKRFETGPVRRLGASPLAVTDGD